MKVLIIAFGHPDNVFSLAHYLGEKVDLTVLYVAVGKRFTRGLLDLEFKDTIYGHFDDEYIRTYFPNEITEYANGKFKIELLRLPSNKIIKDRKFKNLRLVREVCKEIRKRNFDIIHYNGISGFMLYFRFFLKRIPKVWTLHDFKPHSGEENRKSEMVQKFLAGNIDIIQHYEYLKKSITKYYKLKPERVHLLYSGSFDIYTKFKGKDTINEKKYILFFGRISKYKGLNLLLEAYTKIKNPGSKLIIAGSGKFDFDIAEFRKNENIIILNRYIETEELVSLIKNSSFIVVPYSDATHSAAVATAFAFEKPVLAADVGGLSEVVIDNYTGNLFIKGDINDLTEKLFYLINKNKLNGTYSGNIKEFKENGIISWSKIVDGYLGIYQKLIYINES